MFSVVMPVWNKRHTIEATIASVLAQDFGAFELIAVDDGSTDGSRHFLEAVRDPRLRIVAQAHKGAGAARNAGIAASRHEWIAFLDADDLWLSGHLAELDRIRRLHPEAGLIGTAFATRRLNGRHRAIAAGGEGIGAIAFFDRMARRPPFCTSSSAISKRAWRDVGGFGAFPSGQDMEYFCRIALAWPVAASRRATAIYQTGTGGISDSVKSRWYGRELSHARDLLPAVALLLDRYPAIACPGTRRAVDLFVDAQFHSCLRASARIGDFATVRALRALFLRPPCWKDRLLLWAAALPRPLARLLVGAATLVNTGLRHAERALRR